ncbi:MAG: type III secretion system inner membrane ring subunit SctD [Deltaproteobacteria bacterium]|jgi:type III secretion system YscD/HrpQ family protein|nr:type III secretion system inner membrane ring subunit SctD [Deltaproteobacteria bacterium]
MDNGMLLGIFTGNHAGAEALFKADELGEYTIGSALDCDVVLTDSTLASRHCAFSLAHQDSRDFQASQTAGGNARSGASGTAGSVIRLIPLEGSLTLNGEQLSGPLDWPACTPVLAGMVCLAWTQPEKGWAGMKLPSLLTAELKAGENTADFSAESRAENPGNQSAFATINPEINTEAVNKGVAGVTGFSRLNKLIAAGVAILGLFGLIFGLSSYSGKQNDDLTALEHLLSTEGFSDLRVDDNAGRVMIYGLVPTNVDVNTVRAVAARQAYPVQVLVRDREGFRQAILSALAEKGLFPQLQIENGEAILQGYALDSLVESAVLSWARNAVPRVASIRSALLTRGAVEKTLAAELARAGLAGTAVEWQPGLIALSGDAADRPALTGVIEAVRRALGSPIAFRLAISAEPEKIYVGEAPESSNANAESAPTALADGDYSENYAAMQSGAQGQSDPFGAGLSLRSVTPVPAGEKGTAGALPFITTSDGAVYFVGGTLPGGHTLTGIYADKLEFSRNGVSMAYKLQGR